MASGLEHRDQEVGAGMGTVTSSEVAARAMGEAGCKVTPGQPLEAPDGRQAGRPWLILRWKEKGCLGVFGGIPEMPPGAGGRQNCPGKGYLIQAPGWERRDHSTQLALQRYPGLSECT